MERTSQKSLCTLCLGSSLGRTNQWTRTRRGALGGRPSPSIFHMAMMTATLGILEVALALMRTVSPTLKTSEASGSLLGGRATLPYVRVGARVV